MLRMICRSGWSFLVVALLLLLSVSAVCAQNTSFTYQGRLTDGATAANGNYDLQFALFDSLTGDAQVGSTQTVSSVSVSAGIFSVSLDFGASAFTGANRFLEIRARLIGAPSFTTLSPRQQITSTPYAIRSLNASTADTVTASGVPSGSTNYIQNQGATVQDAEFNISGVGRIRNSLIIDGEDAVVSLRSEANNFGIGMWGSSANGVGLRGSGANRGSVAILATGTSWFSGDTTPLSSSFNTGPGTGIAIGSVPASNYGYIFGFDYSSNQARPLVLNHPGGNVGIGTNTPQSKLHVIGSSWFQGDNTPLPPTAGKGIVIGFAGEQGYISSFDYVSNEGKNLLLNNSGGNVGIGTSTPTAPLHVNGGALVTTGNNREVSIGSPNGESGISIRGTSNRADVRFDGTSLRLAAGMGIGPPASTSGVGIDTSGNVSISGKLRLDQIDSGFGAGTVQLCRNAANVIAVCTSSSLRYKQRIAPFNGGLDLIRRLRPISFNWKTDGSRDLGLGAEDVAKVEPLLVTHNDTGEIEGVRYDRLNVVLINAIKEQQKQIETLRAENAALNVRLKSVEGHMRKHKRNQRK